MKKTGANNVYKTLGVKWLNQAFCPASSFVSVDSYETRNPQRFIHATVTGKRKKTLQTDKGDDKMVILKSIQN